MTPDSGLRSRLIYLRPAQEEYDAIVAEANADLRTIRDEALMLIREAIKARKAKK